jgi:redox-sensing transcriptional repressor
VYDSDPGKVGKRIDGFTIRDLATLEKDVAREEVDIAVLTVPAEAAQQVVNRIVKAGIGAVMNFAPVQLQVPESVVIKTVNMAMELEGLSFALANRTALDD